MVAFQVAPGSIYNVSSGKSVSIQNCFKILLILFNIPVEATRDPASVRENDIPGQVCRAVQFNRFTGWKSEIGLARSLEDLLNHGRKKTRTGLE